MHILRRLQAWIHHIPYHERYKFVPLGQISFDLQHAVVAAEDAHFYQHHGFDWHEIQIAAEDDLEGDRTRGASTITQQLVKNLFFRNGSLKTLTGQDEERRHIAREPHDDLGQELAALKMTLDLKNQGKSEFLSDEVEMAERANH